jgi:hypothetical protein
VESDVGFNVALGLGIELGRIRESVIDRCGDRNRIRCRVTQVVIWLVCYT